MGAGSRLHSGWQMSHFGFCLLRITSNGTCKEHRLPHITNTGMWEILTIFTSQWSASDRDRLYSSLLTLQENRPQTGGFPSFQLFPDRSRYFQLMFRSFFDSYMERLHDHHFPAAARCATVHPRTTNVQSLAKVENGGCAENSAVKIVVSRWISWDVRGYTRYIYIYGIYGMYGMYVCYIELYISIYTCVCVI